MLGIAEMVKNGATCFNDMYLKMDYVADAILGSGMRAAVSVGPLMTGKRGSAGVDADSCKAFFKKWDGAGEGNIRVNMEIHSIYLFQPETLAAGAELAKELGATIHIHILETAAERANMLEQYGKSSVMLAEEHGLLGSPVIAAHCVHVDGADIRLLRDSGASVAHNPSSNLKLASGIAPVPEMLREGVNVCLGTDGAASNNSLDMFMEMRLAALLHKGASLDPRAVPAAQAFKMATRSGALALGFGDCGEIAPGRKADIAILRMDSPHLSPLHSHLSALVYSARGSDAETVIVNGRVLMENRELLTIDEEKTKHMARAAAKKFMEGAK
jgi:5-methylthioadenosine/S-adenosylhomocysteine deaminase